MNCSLLLLNEDLKDKFKVKYDETLLNRFTKQTEKQRDKKNFKIFKSSLQIEIKNNIFSNIKHL